MGLPFVDINAARFRLRCRRSDATLLAELGYSHQDDSAANAGVTWFRYYKSIYGAGFLEFVLPGDLPFLSEFDENGQVEVWRQVGGVPWALDFISINVDDYEHAWPDGEPRFHYRGPGIRDVLARAQINYPAGLAGFTEFRNLPAESIMTALVTTNATPAATVANGRLLDFASPFSVTLAADQARGNEVDWFCFQQNLLESLGRLARIGGGDFRFERDPTDYLSFAFGFAPGQLGIDRSATVIFSLQLGNVEAPVVRNEAIGAPTVATVGGPGEREERAFTVVEAENYAVAHHREMFLNASDVETAAGRRGRGAAELDKNRARETFEWRAIQTAQSRYGEHYNLGDLVTVIRPDTGARSVHKIVGVGVAMNEDGDENVAIDTEAQS